MLRLRYTVALYVRIYICSPVKDIVVVNDRWGSGDSCKNGGYFTCHDRYNPGNVLISYISKIVCIFASRAGTNS